jgi:hypothetical protein
MLPERKMRGRVGPPSKAPRRAHLHHALRHPGPIGLGERHRQWLYASMVVLVASGAIWLLFHYFVQLKGEFGEARHPMEAVSLKVHGAAAMLFLVMFGSLIPVHMLKGWALERNLRTAIALLAFNALLLLTGYGLYYASSESAHAWISKTHWIAGLLLPLFLLMHIVSGRRQRS